VTNKKSVEQARKAYGDIIKQKNEWRKPRIYGETYILMNAADPDKKHNRFD
jgi:hypothetical protein